MIDTEVERCFRGQDWSADPYVWENTAMKKQHDFWVTIHGQRGEEWQRVLGTSRIPVKSPLPILANLPGIGEARVHLVALDVLTPGQQEKIVIHLCEKFQLSRNEAEAEIRQAGIPILSQDCTVMMMNFQRWVD